MSILSEALLVHESFEWNIGNILQVHDHYMMVQTTWTSIKLYRFKYINQQVIGYYHTSHLVYIKFVMKRQQINLHCPSVWRDTRLIMNWMFMNGLQVHKPQVLRDHNVPITTSP